MLNEELKKTFGFIYRLTTELTPLPSTSLASYFR